MNQNKNKFSILHINIRSLYKNFPKIENMLFELNQYPDVIALTETKIKESGTQVNRVLNGYTFVHNDTKTSAGGVGIYIKSHICFKLRQDLEIKCREYESIWIEIVQNGKTNVIGVIYRHPNYNFQEFQNNFLNTLHNLNKTRCKFYICGDFNINQLTYYTSSNVKCFIDSIMSLGCENVIKKPTRITTHSATLIDHIYTNNSQNHITAGILIDDISDHLPTFILIETKSIKKVKSWKNTKRKNMNSIEMENFLIDLQNSFLNWSCINSTVEEDFNRFNSTFELIIDEHAPKTTITRKQKKLRQKPWITKGLLKSIRHKNKLYKTFITNKTESSFLNYKQYRNKLNHLLEIAKIQYYQISVIKNKNDSTKLWKTIHEILQTNTKKTNTNFELVNDKQKKTTDEPEIANIFNKFFSTVGSTMASQIQSPKMTPPKQMKSPLSSFFFGETDPEEINQLISELNEKTAVRKNDIEIKYYKIAKSVISPIISKMINKCISQGSFPNCLKIAQVIPVYKKGSKTNCSNYRPISLLSPLSKIFEKIISSRLYNYIEKKQLLSDCQFGFRPNYSTSLAISNICNNILLNKDKGFYTCSIFLDLSKAFDTVDHALLINKLKNCYGIRGTPLCLLNNYLSNRLQYTCINSTISSLESITCGVPQGSVLGPLLFSLYVNDMPLASSFKTTLFADDTLLMMTEYDLNKLQQQVNQNLALIENWLRYNKLSLNYNKTTYLLFTNKGKIKNSNFNVSINKIEIKRSDHVKYLGVYIDDKMNWSYHINHLTQHLRKSIGLICKIRHYVNEKTTRMLYYALVYSHLQYGITSWGFADAFYMKPLNTLHNNVLRILANCGYRTKLSPVYKAQNILKLEDIHKLEVGKLMFKIINNGKPQQYRVLFTKSREIHNHSTRQAKNESIYISQIQTNSGKKSIQYAGAILWNKIPNSIKSLSFTSFKKEYKKQLIWKY